MKRRNFLSNITSGAFGLSAARAAGPETSRKQSDFRASSRLASDGNAKLNWIGTRSLDQLRVHFDRELNETLSYWQREGIDHRYGGFLHKYVPDGKMLYDQGRILWIFSYAYNNFGRKPAYLEAARQGKEALVKHALLENGHWATRLTLDWKLQRGFFDIYADIYMILGLGEYYKASGDKQALELAVKTSYLAPEAFLASHYQGQGHGSFYEPGIKRLGTWLHFLSGLTPLLKYTKDDGIERIVRFCVRAMVEKHWNRDKGYIYENLDYQYEPFSYSYLSDYDGEIHCVTSFHSMQAAWMTMDEALRIGSREMFKDGLEMGFDTLSIHWEDGPISGLNMYADPVHWKPINEYTRLTNIVAEAMVFLLMAIEHTHLPLASQWFERIFGSAYQPHHEWDRANTLHQPRAIMLCRLALDRMIARQGRVSGFFA